MKNQTIHTNSNSSLESILSKLSVIDFKYKLLANDKEQFNIFSILHKENDEVKLHSRFISIMLSPNSKHKKGTKFLELFLKAMNVTTFEVENSEVLPNEYNRSEYNNIDILIINRLSRQAIIIENKIGAGDSNHEDRGQLEGYFELVQKKEKIDAKNIQVFYLSPDGRNPSVESLGKYKKLENINGRTIEYGFEILNWLNDCLKEVINEPFIRESINQYINLINKMTNNDTNIEERLEIRDLIASNDENMKGAKLLIENFNHVKWHTVWDFWEEMKSELEKSGLEVTNYPTNENVTYTTHFEPYKNSYQTNNDYGITCLTKKKIELIIWNGTNEDWIYWGIKKKSLLESDLTNIENYIQSNPNTFEQNDELLWKYFSLTDEENIFFCDFKFQGTFNLINKNYRLNMITNNLVPEVIDLIKKMNIQ